MKNVIYALAVPFACGVGVQRLLAILDSVWAKLKLEPPQKAWISALVSFVCGLFIVIAGDVHVLEPIAKALLDSIPPHLKCVDPVVSALIISAGTEGFNSIIKFLGYAKEQMKASAANQIKVAKQGDADALKAVFS